jgi:hypothetical protein
MCTKSEQDLLSKISEFSDDWFRKIVEFPDTPFSNQQKCDRGRTPNQRVRIIRQKVADCIVKDVTTAFDLDRCGLLSPVQNKHGLWRLSAHFNYPDKVLKRNTYRQDLGLSGHVLSGKTIYSPDFIKDVRRSGYHDGKWVSANNEIERNPSPRALLGVPIWTHFADLHRRTYGAIISIKLGDFTEYERLAMSLVSDIVAPHSMPWRLDHDPVPRRNGQQLLDLFVGWG